ncbi:hypothetical protein D3C86_1906140 [compost metagenome]
MILVERFFLFVHKLVVLPRFRNHHHRAVSHGTSRQVHELERIVEHSRIGTIRRDNRLDLLQIVTEQLRIK